MIRIWIPDPCTKIVSCLCVPPAATLKWEEVSPCAHSLIVYCSIVVLEHGGGDRSVNLQFPTRWWEPSPKQLSERLGESFGTSCRVSRSAAFGSLTLTAKVPGNQPPDGEGGKKQIRFTFSKNAYGVWITVRFVRGKKKKHMWNLDNAENTLPILDRNAQSLGRQHAPENVFPPNRHGGSCQFFTFPTCVRCHIARIPHCRSSQPPTPPERDLITTYH